MGESHVSPTGAELGIVVGEMEVEGTVVRDVPVSEHVLRQVSATPNFEQRLSLFFLTHLHFL